jgi:phosphatidylinositol 3-kinase
VQVGFENPAELKAAKLARSSTRGVIDRDLKPNSDERRAIAKVLKLPPNKPLHADERALLWRFRFSLTGEKRALTKFLKCVDWSDAQEAKQVCGCVGFCMQCLISVSLPARNCKLLNADLLARC